MSTKKLIKIYLKDSFIIFLLSISTFLTCDALLTKILKTRGFSQFFESNEFAGFINRREFSGKFGGILDEFSNIISINKNGTREVISGECTSFISERANRNFVFVGDSMLAGFEVSDSDHYVSRISKMCLTKGSIINGGVRAHDTHMASANAVRILEEFKLNPTNSIIVYAVTNNDFYENDNKNSYYNMKARFGSIFDQKKYQPKANLNYLKLRMFVGDNFYFTTKFIHNFQKLRKASSKNSQNQRKYKSTKCRRLISIMNSTLSSGSIKSKVLLFVHPNFKNLEQTKNMENCLASASINQDQIKIIPLHKNLLNKISKINYEKFIFKRDPTILQMDINSSLSKFSQH